MVNLNDSINIGRILLEDGLITHGQLLHAFDRRLENGYTVMRNIIDLGYIEEEEIARCLSRHYAVPATYLAKSDSLYYLLEIIDKCRKSQYEFIPLDLIHNIITVGLRDTPDEVTLKRIEDLTGLVVKVVMLSRDQFDKYVGRAMDYSESYLNSDSDRPGMGREGRFIPAENRERRRFPRFNKELKVKYELNNEYN